MAIPLDRRSGMIGRRGMIVGAGATLGLALVAGCGTVRERRYKMTVEVETPQGLRSGFAVREIVDRQSPHMPMLGEDRGSTFVRGEAVVVDLGGGCLLLALLIGADGYVDYAGSGISAVFRMMDRAGQMGGPHELWPNVPQIGALDPVPMLATFRDPADRRTVERVEPNALYPAFGAGVRLRRIVVEASSEPLTVGIGDKLPWLERVDETSPGADFRPKGIPVGNFRSLFSAELAQ